LATRGARRKRSVRGVYIAAGVCFSLAALLGAGAAVSADAATNPVTSVSVHDYAFSPNAITIAVNTDVRFTNTGQALHRVVSDDGTLDSHPLQPGHNATFHFGTLGVFRLHCEIHPTMTMTVTVVASSPAAGAPANDQSKTAAAPTATSTTASSHTLPMTGAGTMLLSLFGLVLIVLGLGFLMLGRNSMSTIPAVAAASQSTIARVRGWENRFDDLLPGRATDVLRRGRPTYGSYNTDL
jgi:LPXTG-motif cell wall-anchored protein